MTTADYRGYELSGWFSFAAIMLILVGTLNAIDGIAAIANSNYLVHQLLFANMHAWGWFFLIWGIIQICAGFALFSGATWAVLLGITTAFLNIIAQLSWARTYPVWAVSAIVIDVLIIYGLIVHAGERAE
jgi:hypothetical protein